MSWELEKEGLEKAQELITKRINKLRETLSLEDDPTRITRFEEQLKNALSDLEEKKRLIFEGSSGRQYVGNDVHALLEKLKQLLDRTTGKDQQQVGEWIRQLESPDGSQLLAKIRFESDRMKEGLENIQPVDYQDLKIWLNRRQQRDAFRGHLRNSCTKADKVSPVLFCMTGHIELDGLADAAEMLRRFHIDDLLRIANREYIKLWDSKDSLGLSTPRDARNAYESLMQDVFDLGFFADDVAISSALEQHHQHHIILRCRVRNWSEEGLAAFFKIWLLAFERDRSFPFLLLLEFADVDFNRLGELLGTADFCDCSIALLPKLGEVEAQDVEDFYDRPLKIEGYARYDDLFDRDSLTPADAPLRYRPAINKLKLKTQ